MQSRNGSALMGVETANWSRIKREDTGAVNIHASEELTRFSGRGLHLNRWRSGDVRGSKTSEPSLVSARLTEISNNYNDDSEVHTIRDHVSSIISKTLGDSTCGADTAFMTLESKRLVYAPHHVIARAAATKATAATEALIDQERGVTVTPTPRTADCEQDQIGMLAATSPKTKQGDPESAASNVIRSAIRAVSSTPSAAIPTPATAGQSNDASDGDAVASILDSAKILSLEDVEAAYAGRMHLANIPEHILRNNLSAFIEKHEAERTQRLDKKQGSRVSQVGVLKS